MKLRLAVAFLILLGGKLWAQDPQFTQFYAAPIYHNPAFTGSAYAPRVMMNYRNQWPTLNANFITSMFTIDHYIDKANSGIGLMFINDKQGYRLTNNEVRLSYAYEFKIDKDNGVRFGLNGGASSRRLGINGLIFGDQFGPNGDIIESTKDPIADSDLRIVNNFDVGTGFLYFNPKYYVGVSMNHLTQPKVSYYKDNIGSQSGIPRFLVINGGYNINLDHLITTGSSDREFTLTPTFLYKKQGPFSQLDLGAYITYTPFTVGLQYRGIPLKKVFNSFPNQDAISGMIGFRHENFSFGYSYDLTVSGLGGRSGGSHEVSIAFQLERFESEKNARYRNRKKALACPKF